MLRGLLGLGFSIYGLATLILVLAFSLTGMPARTFMRLFSVLLFVVGSMLIADGALSIRTGIDRIGQTLRQHADARWAGVAKVGAGCLALTLMVVGLAA